MNKLMIASAFVLLPTLASAGLNCSSLQSAANNAYNKSSFLINNQQNFLTCKNQCSNDGCNQAFNQLIFDSNYALIYQGLTTRDGLNSSNSFSTSNSAPVFKPAQSTNNSDDNAAATYTAPLSKPVTIQPKQTKKNDGISWF